MSIFKSKSVDVKVNNVKMALAEANPQELFKDAPYRIFKNPDMHTDIFPYYRLKEEMTRDRDVKVTETVSYMVKRIIFHSGDVIPVDILKMAELDY